MIGLSAGKSYAYLLGVYLGDGCVTLHQGYLVFRLNTIDREFAEATKAALAEYTKRPIAIHEHAVKGSRKNNFSLRCGDPDICQALQSETERKAIIPAYVFEWPLDHKMAFIAGLMDSEGFVAANGVNPTNRRFYMGFKSCDGWVPEFVRLLESVGIRIGKVQTEAPRKPGYKPPTRFTIKMQSWIDAGGYFNIPRKQSRVDQWASSGPYENRSSRPRRLTSETTRQTPETVMI